MQDGTAWLARHPDGFTMQFASQSEAAEYARAVARRFPDCHLIVYGPSGEIQLRESF
jgi:hypothetical protein